MTILLKSDQNDLILSNGIVEEKGKEEDWVIVKGVESDENIISWDVL